MKLVKIFSVLLVALMLTVLTQVGGILFLASLVPGKLLEKSTKWRTGKFATWALSLLTLYSASVFILVPVLARRFGRTPLPFFKENHVKAGNPVTWILFRNYVRPELQDATFQVAEKLNTSYPGTVVNYLDANFPFFDGFPLLPHLSHNDGKKLDVSFFYLDSSGRQTDKLPSFIGYGICEGPAQGEEDRPAYCEKKGYWQYSFLSKLVSQDNKNDFPFDPERTRAMVHLFSNQAAIGKIFIEPHLQTRLHLASSKIRFHGCQAVRHDDHLHVQLK